MTRVLALDQATTTGWTLGDDQLPLSMWVSGRFKAPKRDQEGERLIIVHDSVLELIGRFDPHLIVYETPFNPTSSALKNTAEGKPVRAQFSMSTMNFQQRIAAAITMAAARRSIHCEDYAPQSWQAMLKLPKHQPAHIEAANWGKLDEKKLWQARRNWRKDMILQRIHQLGGKVEGHDEADSFGLALYALRGRPAAERAQGDLLARVAKEPRSRARIARHGHQP